MAVPVTTCRIDWDNDGDFADAYENLDGRVLHLSWTRGRSSDFSTEATGAARIVLRNNDDLYTPDGPSGPTAAQLVPGRPVHIYATYSATDYAQFYGFIERLEYDPRERTVTIVCYDPLRRLAETDVVVPALPVQRSARELRIAALEDFERGTLNMLANPTFATDTSNWTATGGSLTRSATGGPAGISDTYATWSPSSSSHLLKNHARLSPRLLTGETYRYSVYLRTSSGTSSWVMELATAAAISSRTISVTTTWTRFTITGTIDTDYRMADQPLVAQLYSVAGGGGTIRVSAAQVTRGQALVPYANVGTGRWANFVGNGSFDGQATTGWYNAWANLITNPSFETNTAGWSVAGDAFTTAATSITRVAADARWGSARADLTMPVLDNGAFFAITGTFSSGVVHEFGIWLKATTGTPSVEVGIGSQGSPSDFASFASSLNTGSYTLFSGTWTPSGNRTDAHFFVRSDAGIAIVPKLDGAYVFRHDGAANKTYTETGPGGGGSFVSTAAASTAIVKYGSHAFAITTPATSTAGVVYDLNHIGPYFISGQAYTVSVWIRATTAMPYKIGIGANKGDGTWDEASTTGTLTANTWTQVTVTWTPTADRTSAAPWDVVLYVLQTNATARTFYLDGVRIIPGSAADEFEMAQWDLDANVTGEAGDTYLATSTLSGSALAALSALNDLTLTRHWIRPEMTGSLHAYVVEDRVTVAAKASVETYNDDINDMTQADIDRASIVNIVPVTFAGGAEFYGDADSIAAYGPRPGSAIGGALFFPNRTIPDLLGPALVTRYKDPRARPEITIVNRWPSQLQRELNDMVTVNFVRLLISGREYLIQRLTTTVSDSGNTWTTVYALEEAP